MVHRSATKPCDSCWVSRTTTVEVLVRLTSSVAATTLATRLATRLSLRCERVVSLLSILHLAASLAHGSHSVFNQPFTNTLLNFTCVRAGIPIPVKRISESADDDTSRGIFHSYSNTIQSTRARQ